jgi:transcription initiation factor TFIIIB Brf1 subunit/transcription initiation factor TFIIB
MHIDTKEDYDLKVDIDRHIKDQRSKPSVCSGCSSPFDSSLISDGYIVCQECGLVQDICLDQNAEWRCFANDAGGKNISGVRCGDTASSLLPGTQLNTYIGGKDKRLQRVHQWNNLTQKERNLHQIYKDYEQIGQSHDIPHCVIAAAAELYNKLYTEMEKQNCGVKRCNVRQGLKAACLYYACKQLDMPRERKEIAEMVGNNAKIVTKGCNSFLDIMGGEYVNLEPFTPEDFVTRFSLLMGLPYSFQVKLKNIVKYISQLESLSDNTPTSVTCACIYFISVEYKLGISKEDIHKKCGSSTNIIVKTYAKITPYRDELLTIVGKQNRIPGGIL